LRRPARGAALCRQPCPDGRNEDHTA
jgi:hypothetical protein